MTLNQLAMYILLMLYAPFLFEWMERKTRARIQMRYGPRYNSPFGILQPVYDFFKLLKKEDIKPRAAGRLFDIIPYIRLVVLLLPFSFWFLRFQYSMLVLIAVVVIDSMLIWIMGFNQKSRFSLLGASRNVIQRISFEIPLFILLITPALVTGSFDVIQVFNPIFIIPFCLSIVPVLAELEMIPFDIPRAGSEIIAGWETEYSGKKLALLRYQQSAKYALLSLLISTAFFGTGFTMIKAVLAGFLLAFINAIFARYRIYDVVAGAWKYLVPISIIQLVVIWSLF